LCRETLVFIGDQINLTRANVMIIILAPIALAAKFHDVVSSCSIFRREFALFVCGFLAIHRLSVMLESVKYLGQHVITSGVGIFAVKTHR